MIADSTVIAQRYERPALENGYNGHNGYTALPKTLLSSSSSHREVDNLFIRDSHKKNILEGSPDMATSSRSVVDIVPIHCAQKEKT